MHPLSPCWHVIALGRCHFRRHVRYPLLGRIPSENRSDATTTPKLKTVERETCAERPDESNAPVFAVSPRRRPVSLSFSLWVPSLSIRTLPPQTTSDAATMRLDNIDVRGICTARACDSNTCSFAGWARRCPTSPYVALRRPDFRSFRRPLHATTSNPERRSQLTRYRYTRMRKYMQ